MTESEQPDHQKKSGENNKKKISYEKTQCQTLASNYHAECGWKKKWLLVLHATDPQEKKNKNLYLGKERNEGFKKNQEKKKGPHLKIQIERTKDVPWGGG